MLLEINLSSINSSIVSIRLALLLNFIFSNDTLFISSINSLSIGGTI